MESKFYLKASITILLTLACPLLIWGCFLSNVIITIIGVPFFTIGAVYMLQQILRLIFHRPVLIINSQGIIDRTSFANPGKLLPWECFDHVALLSAQGPGTV